MINYDNIDLNDQQLDFDTEGQMLVNALKQSQELQKPRFKTYEGQGNVIAPWTPGASIGNITNRLAGQLDQRRVQGDMRALAQEEGRRFDKGINELNQLDPNIDYTNPASIEAAHNNRQIALMNLSRLPKTRKMAEAGFIKSSPFADALAKQKMSELFKDDQLGKGLASKEFVADLVARTSRANNADTNATRITIADTRPDPGDAAEKKAQAKAAASLPKDSAAAYGVRDSMANMMLHVDDVRQSPGLSMATGVVGKYNPTSILTGTDAAEAENRITTLKSGAMKMGRDLMNESGKIGAMAVAEWPIVEAAITAIDPTKMSLKQMHEALANVEMKVRAFSRKAELLYQEQEEFAGVPEEKRKKFTTIDTEFKNKKAERDRIKAEGLEVEKNKGKTSVFPKATGQSQTADDGWKDLD